ncbi:hypothetical protein CRYUN_Cryun26dG0127500 [Craigia yunnanensis]
MESNWLWMVLVALLLGGWCDGCLEQEKTALLQLKPFFSHIGEEGKACCEWKTVECNVSTGRVMRLFLNLTTPQAWYYYNSWRDDWYLNASLFLPFEELKSLYLTGNSIAGCVYNEGFEKLSSKLNKLENLYLSNNRFNDSILASLSELSSLKILNLADNQFTSSNPNYGFKWLSRLSNLETLNLAGNYLENNFLLHVGGFSSLKSLDLGYNLLKGTVDIQELNSLTNLTKLDLRGNGIESFQGSRRQLMMTLQVLDLSSNLLKNSSFAYISGLSNLKSLSIRGNKLQGSIDIKDSEKQLKLIDLEEFDLSFNLFNNNILTQFNELSNLKSLNVESNHMKGSLNIKELEALNDLEELDFSYNELHEFLAPEEIGSFKKLRVAKLEGVFINGSVSLLQLLQAFSSVKTLFFGRNYLNKTISTQEFNLSRSNVEELFLDYSYLSNNILERIGALTSLKTLMLSNCGLTGTLPAKGWCDLRNLEDLALNENALEGTFPSCLGNLTNLHFLDVSNNHFEVPASFISFANHSHLKVLFINQNNLVREPTFQTWSPTPKFQLKVLGMSNCTTKGLLKELPNFLYYQYDLRFLQLSYNNFGGKIPSWLLENNTRLQQLFLIGNSFTGPLPLPKHSNVNMFEIGMSRNKIQGQIPMNICSTFPHLEVLSLFQNAFEGNIPPCLGDLKTLSMLDLSYNNFSGGILGELARSNTLETLRLSNNNLSGKIVPTIFCSNALTGLYLDGNNFDGEIPLIDISTLGFPLLLDIDLSNNHLSGRIPRWIWNVSGLQTLDLSNNHLAGLIPSELCNLDWLEFLDLSQNNLSGSLPSCFNPPNIKHVHLSRNKLSGPLPRALYKSSSLVTLDLSQNNLTGKIPYWIGTVSALSILIMKANHFEGKIPSQLCQLNSLSIMDLSQNKLFGPIPSCLSNLTLEPKDEKSYFSDGASTFGIRILQDLAFESRDSGQIYPGSYVEEQVEFATKKGLYMYSGNILKYMSGIDLSCNRLTGQIPQEIGNLSELHSLNLSNNNLTGFIPSTFSKLKQIESLDLSNNNLSGRIPIQLTELNSLAVFNVSYNNFSGSIPFKAQFWTFDESSYMGNPFLCGPPLHENCTESDSPPTVPNASDGEKEYGLVDKFVFYVSFWVTYGIVLVAIATVLYINPYWRQAWFYFVEHCITACHYFVVDNLLQLSMFRRS